MVPLCFRVGGLPEDRHFSRHAPCALPHFIWIEEQQPPPTQVPHSSAFYPWCCFGKSCVCSGQNSNGRLFPTCAPRSPSEHTAGPTNPADLQDFFNRIFKGAPPNNMAANGGFFPSGPPHHPQPSAGVPPFSPPTGPTGFYMPGSHRTESSEPWAEGGKPPRRRKKVRKPFQR